MTFSLNISIDDQVTPWMKTVVSKQIPFATARALTWTAKDAQKETRREIRRSFTLRNKWTERGIRIVPASKNKLESKVVFDRYYMVLHEGGGEKVPGRSSFLAVPSRKVRRTKTARIAKSERPSALMRKKNTFINTLRKTGEPAILQREGKRSRPIRVMYILVPKANITDRLEFIKTTIDTARQRLSRNFDVSVTDALRSAR